MCHQRRLQDLLRRPRGLPRAIFNPITNPGRALGYSEWGFTKANEVFAGRWVQHGPDHSHQHAGPAFAAKAGRRTDTGHTEVH
jgi:hypothetical protein